MSGLKTKVVVGRKVGYLVPYSVHPSERRPKEPPQTHQLRWGRVVDQFGTKLTLIPSHGNDRGLQFIDYSSIHTIMPEMY